MTISQMNVQVVMPVRSYTRRQIRTSPEGAIRESGDPPGGRDPTGSGAHTALARVLSPAAAGARR